MNNVARIIESEVARLGGVRKAAREFQVSTGTVENLRRGGAVLTPAMAVRLVRASGLSVRVLKEAMAKDWEAVVTSIIKGE